MAVQSPSFCFGFAYAKTCTLLDFSQGRVRSLTLDSALAKSRYSIGKYTSVNSSSVVTCSGEFKYTWKEGVFLRL